MSGTGEWNWNEPQSLSSEGIQQLKESSMFSILLVVINLAVVALGAANNIAKDSSQGNSDENIDPIIPCS